MEDTPIDRAAKECGGFRELAEAIGVGSVQVISNWKARGRAPVDQCAAIEAASGGKVTRRELRPEDWHRIWPELVTDGHPAPAEPTTEPART